MEIIYRKGDLLECEEPWILHGCNCQGVMGSGVALAIKNKYPSAYHTYRAQEETRGLALGDLSYSQQEDGKTIFNGLTQEFYGRKGKFVSYEAVEQVIQGVNYLVEHWGQQGISVAMPKIGSGLGGGNWEIISTIIEVNAISFQPVVYELG